jgi:hypothetical protein
MPTINLLARRLLCGFLGHDFTQHDNPSQQYLSFAFYEKKGQISIRKMVNNRLKGYRSATLSLGAAALRYRVVTVAVADGVAAGTAQKSAKSMLWRCCGSNGNSDARGGPRTPRHAALK